MAEQRTHKPLAGSSNLPPGTNMTPIWVLVNCNSTKEAKEIGDKVLEKRLGSCFDVFLREHASYFWPPKTSRIEKAKGTLLMIESFKSKYRDIHVFVKNIHSDKLPFIGYIEMSGLEENYLEWMKGEINN